MAQQSKRCEIQALLKAEKYSVVEIAKQVRVARFSVYCVKKRIEQNQSVVHKRGGGRPANIRNKVKYSCSKYIQHDAQKPVREIASDILCMSGVSASKTQYIGVLSV